MVIPLYNAEKYIAECLDSILAQTFTDFEVIVVDDCSTDSSCEIVQSYAEKFDGRLTLSRMDKNHGSGAVSRNRGLMLSRGEYVFNMDNDDLITKTALEELYTLAKDYDADVVYCEKFYRSDSAGKNIYFLDEKHYEVVDKPTIETGNLSDRIHAFVRNKHRVEPWTKFVRRKLLIEREIIFPPLKIADDDIWTYGLILYANKFLHVPNAVYIWRQTEDSLYRGKKTLQDTLTFWVNPILLGLKTLDNFIGKHEFFQKNPQHRYAVLEGFVNKMFDFILNRTFQLPPFAVHEIIKREFGAKLGDQDVLVAALCTALNTQQKINAVNAQKFNQFAAQAQQRIAQLEAALKNRQS